MIQKKSFHTLRFLLPGIMTICGLFLCNCATSHKKRGDGLPGATTVAGAQSLPVKRVVLFQNGVAYMERRGLFEGDELHLKVRPSQIQDILKSITVVDFKGGHARSLALPVDLTSEKALAELPKMALGQGALGDILNVVRGAWVRVETKHGDFEGRMVGVETVTGEEGGQQVSMMDAQGIIRTFPRDQVKSVQILDAALSQGLEKGLDISLGQESWKPIDLAVYFNKGKSSERDLLVSYLVEMPTWKPTYRLVLDKNNQPLLQAWAIVDNVSGADWNDVQLTLTTGSPVSFNYDLYTPRFVARPNLTPYQTLGIAPPTAVSTTTPGMVGGLIAQEKKEYAPSPPPPPASRSQKNKEYKRARRGNYEQAREEDADESGSVSDMPAPEPSLSSDSLYGSMQVQAQTQKVGSLYRFDLQEPMTVPNRSSSMIALLNRKVPGEAVYYYNPQASLEAARQHPFRAVSLANQTDAVLEPGPISIVRDGTFVGEGLLDRIEKGSRSYISYALDTAVSVSYNANSTAEFASLTKISRGIIETKSFSILRHVFEAQASKEDGEAIPMLLTLPKRPGWDIEFKNGKQESETATTRFISMPIVPGEKAVLEVREKYPTFTSYHITDFGGQQAVLTYLESKGAKAEIVAQLKPLAEKVRKLADLNGQIQTVEKQRSDLQQRANEIRANLALLKNSKNQKLKDEQMERLMSVDKQASKLTDTLVAARAQADELTVEINNLIEKLEITF